MSKIVPPEFIVRSLRRAQKLKDAGIIGQNKEWFGAFIDGKPCFCAEGTVYADLGFMQIDRELGDVFLGGLDDWYILETYGVDMVYLNDREDLSFGEIADRIENNLAHADH